MNLIWLLNIPIPVEIFTLCADDYDSIDSDEKTTTTIGRCCYIVECELTFPPRTRENSIRFAYSLRCTTKSNPCKTCKTKQKPRNHFMSYSNLLRWIEIHPHTITAGKASRWAGGKKGVILIFLTKKAIDRAQKGMLEEELACKVATAKWFSCKTNQNKKEELNEKRNINFDETNELKYAYQTSPDILSEAKKKSTTRRPRLTELYTEQRATTVACNLQTQ